jgi:hypothetical protein
MTLVDLTLKTHVTLKSSNAKTGPLATTYREQSSCPTTCPLMGNGCYASGRIFGIPRKYGSADNVAVLALITSLKPGQGLRLNVSGDFLGLDGEPDVDYIDACNRVATERPDVKIIAYTHAWRTLTPSMFAFGVNASCESAAEVAEARAAGWGTVMVNGPVGETIDGSRVVRCPAEYRDDTTCASCMLCAKTPGLDTTVSFTAHGAGKAKATAAVAAAQ